MKKIIAVLLTVAFLAFATTFLPVAANEEEELPMSIIPPFAVTLLG